MLFVLVQRFLTSSSKKKYLKSCKSAITLNKVTHGKSLRTVQWCLSVETMQKTGTNLSQDLFLSPKVCFLSIYAEFDRWP